MSDDVETEDDTTDYVEETTDVANIEAEEVGERGLDAFGDLFGGPGSQVAISLEFGGGAAAHFTVGAEEFDAVKGDLEEYMRLTVEQHKEIMDAQADMLIKLTDAGLDFGQAVQIAQQAGQSAGRTGENDPNVR